jgi:hypothetical protein
MKAITQWHETHEITEKNITFIMKYYKPNSYEIKTELSWLTTNMFNAKKFHDSQYSFLVNLEVKS